MGRDNEKALLKSAGRVAENCVANRVRLLNRVISAIYNEELCRHGITVGQFNVLTVILKRQPTSAVEISSILQLEKSSVSRNLELMRRNGWIAVETVGRNATLSVADRGAAIFQAALPSWEQAQKRSMAILGRGGAARVSNIVRKVRKRQAS
jgi:DNA-binding MarR family transcriptional regulator